ncbi:MAG: hypothetical protein KKH74_00805 [Gammaproteobacteria bacterium]|nr:hypothetical protein [Gammaproteobacteria bacterium]MBU1733390.1 hypothetical protein [Gammaproteobacteria bacterium]MBU1891807.1 hypothetical protein [Gammaproteobacteria bacterium]
MLRADGKANLVAALKPLLPSDTILCTDESSVLAAVVMPQHDMEPGSARPGDVAGAIQTAIS